MSNLLGYGPLKSIQWAPPIVLVGESNPYGSDPRYALYDEPRGAAGHRLRTLIFGVRRATYARFHRANLCDWEWILSVAKAKVKRLCADLPTATFVLCGKKVQNAFNFRYEREPFSTWEEAGDPEYDGLKFVLIPHPSGRNREWNREGSFERARVLLRAARPDVPWGEESCHG